jgi:transcriptional regulator with XRE-family HTH domain
MRSVTGDKRLESQQRGTHELGRLVKRVRRSIGWSIRRLGSTAGVDPTYISRLERGAYVSPDPRALARLAAALGLDSLELFVAAGYRSSTALPSLAPYLRAKYDLAPEAIHQLEDAFERVRRPLQSGLQEGQRYDERLA